MRSRSFSLEDGKDLRGGPTRGRLGPELRQLWVSVSVAVAAGGEVRNSDGMVGAGLRGLGVKELQTSVSVCVRARAQACVFVCL